MKHTKQLRKQAKTCSKKTPLIHKELLHAPAVEQRMFLARFSATTAAQRWLPLKSPLEAPEKMRADKTLIAYESKGGATEEAARKIAETLRSKFQLEVDLVDLKEQKPANLAQYQNVVIGGGVRAGKIYDKTLKFLDNDLTGKKVAFFVSSGEAGTAGSYEKAKIKFVENTLSKYPKINPVAWDAFGGRIRILGKTVSDNTDLVKIEVWAEELGKKFTQ
jgi:menaquinone-dependent protoporphyrinogen IX oxidase